MNNPISKNSKLFQRIKSTDYEVDREGLINLKDEKSIEKKVITWKVFFLKYSHLDGVSKWIQN